ncbi:hypothetical protein BKA80DRAFT_256520 [Phyllosticta citrichinensis]
MGSRGMLDILRLPVICFVLARSPAADAFSYCRRSERCGAKVGSLLSLLVYPSALVALGMQVFRNEEVCFRFPSRQLPRIKSTSRCDAQSLFEVVMLIARPGSPMNSCGQSIFAHPADENQIDRLQADALARIVDKVNPQGTLGPCSAYKKQGQPSVVWIPLVAGTLGPVPRKRS